MTTQDATIRSTSNDTDKETRIQPAILADVRLLLICHAEDMHDVYRDLSHENSGLTARGWEQSDTVARWLQTHERIDQLVSGQQLHSRLTAQRIGQTLSLPVRVDRTIPRCAVADWRFWDSAAASPPEAGAGSDSADRGANEPPINDAYLEFYEALSPAIGHLVDESHGKTVALVTCSNTIATIVRHFCGSHQISIQSNHTGVTELRCLHGQWQLRYSNRREHLPTAPLPPDEVAHPTPKPVNVDENLPQITKIYNRVAMADLNRKTQDDVRRIRHLLDFAQLPPEQHIVDVGTGVGILPLMLAEDGAQQVIGIDVSPAMLERAEYMRLSASATVSARVSFRLAPAQILPLCDGQFDAVICRLVLHHSRAPEQIVREVARVLKPGGVFVMADLLGDDDPVKRATQNAIEERRNPGHVAARTVEEYKRLVADAGLQLQNIETVSFKRELEEWLYAMQADPANGALVRDMIEAGLETDAAGINARHQDGALIFSQRVIYIKATK